MTFAVKGKQCFLASDWFKFGLGPFPEIIVLHKLMHKKTGNTPRTTQAGDGR